jgi:hypothetical protein
MVDGLEITPSSDGYIVYQQDKDRVHYLNQTAAIVLELCNGRNSTMDIPELIRDAFDLSSPPVLEVKGCLEGLQREGLIVIRTDK